MSYSAYTWETGDTVTAEKLNTMEQGIEDASVFTVNLTPTSEDLSGTMDKTAAQLYAAVMAGKRVVASIEALSGLIVFSQFLYNMNNQVASCVGQFLYDVGGQNMLVNVQTAIDSQTYSTSFFPLTPLS